MIKAKFEDGPYIGQVKDLPYDQPPPEIFMPQPGKPDPGPMVTSGKHRYVLHFTRQLLSDAQLIAHYHTPSGDK
jgi:hypothetical protein